MNNDISYQFHEEFSFKFGFTIKNTLAKSNSIYTELIRIFHKINENIHDKAISSILFKEVNNNSYVGDMVFQFVFFSKEQECISRYSHFFKEFNSILHNDIQQDSLKKEIDYIDIFNKISLKNKLKNSFPEKLTRTTLHKI